MPYAFEDTIGLLELGSIARGIEAADALLKRAAVRVLFARPVSPGKYVVLFTGSVEDAAAALEAGVEAAAGDLLDRLFLPSVHPGVFDALERPVRLPELDALGVVETTTVAGAVGAADIAAKTADVTLVELRLAQGIGGKSFVTFMGAVGDVESALDAACLPLEERGALVARALIPRLHADMGDVLERHEGPL